MAPSSERTTTNAMDWLIKTAGLVDKVCCYAYSEQQVYGEATAVEVPSTSWDLSDENSVVNKHSSISRTRSEYEFSCNDDRLLAGRKAQRHQYRYDIADDMTATTVTTSTAPTQITSLRTVDVHSIGSTTQTKRRLVAPSHSLDTMNHRTRPKEIYLRAHSDGDNFEKSYKMRPSSSRPFGSTTEGYQC